MRDTTAAGPANSAPISTFSDQRAQTAPKLRHGQISYSTLAIGAVKQLIFPHYGIADGADCILLSRYTNDIFFIETRDESFALRISPSSWRSREAILAEITALEHISARCAEVAIPIRRNDGTWITCIRAPEGLRSAVLFRWAKGRALRSTDPTEAHLYGRHLARLHAAADDMPPCKSRPLMKPDYLVRYPMNLILPSLKKLGVDVQQVEALAERIEGRLACAQEQLHDWGFCHGDVHAGNVSINDSSLVSFDFDDCGTGWRIYDLASYKWDVRHQGVDKVAWRPFLDGYLEARRDAADSVEFVGLFTILRHLWLLSQWIILAPLMGGSLLHNEYLRNLVTFCEEIEAEV